MASKKITEFAQMRAFCEQFEVGRYPKIAKFTNCTMEFNTLKGTIQVIQGTKVILRIRGVAAQVLSGSMIELTAAESGRVRKPDGR